MHLLSEMIIFTDLVVKIDLSMTQSLHAVAVVILAEDRSIQEKLMYYDLKVQTIAQVAPIQLYAASVLSSLFAHLGRRLYVWFLLRHFIVT